MLLEYALEEVVEVVAPVRGVVGVAVHIPDVRHVLLLHIEMHALADSDEPVLISTGEPEQLELLFGRRRVWQKLSRGFRVRRGREAADPAERVEVRQPEIQGLAAAHRETGDGAMVLVGCYGI